MHFTALLGSNVSTMHTSLVQAFDEHGEGLVLRGPEFNWNAKGQGSKSPHLNEEQHKVYLTQRLIVTRTRQARFPSAGSSV